MSGDREGVEERIASFKALVERIGQAQDGNEEESNATMGSEGSILGSPPQTLGQGHSSDYEEPQLYMFSMFLKLNKALIERDPSKVAELPRNERQSRIPERPAYPAEYFAGDTEDNCDTDNEAD